MGIITTLIRIAAWIVAGVLVYFAVLLCARVCRCCVVDICGAVFRRNKNNNDKHGRILDILNGDDGKMNSQKKLPNLSGVSNKKRQNERETDSKDGQETEGDDLRV